MVAEGFGVSAAAPLAPEFLFATHSYAEGTMNHHTGQYHVCAIGRPARAPYMYSPPQGKQTVTVETSRTPRSARSKYLAVVKCRMRGSQFRSQGLAVLFDPCVRAGVCRRNMANNDDQMRFALRRAARAFSLRSAYNALKEPETSAPTRPHGVAGRHSDSQRRWYVRSGTQDMRRCMNVRTWIRWYRSAPLPRHA